MTNQPPSLNTGSLLDESTLSEVAAPSKQARPPLAQRLASCWSACWSGPRQRIISSAVILALLAGGATSAYLALRPTPKPDYEEDPLNMVFDFTFLEEEFNRLPVEERIRLLGQLWERMQGMDTSQSVLMASFAAGIMGPMREQLERNMSRLMIDVGDKFAAEYEQVLPEEREQWLESSYVRMVRLTEAFDPRMANRSDEELLRRGRRDAQRNADALQSGQVGIEETSRFLSFAYRQGRDNASSRREQQRLAVFFRDMTRQLREGGEEQPPANPGGGS